MNICFINICLLFELSIFSCPFFLSLAYPLTHTHSYLDVLSVLYLCLFHSITFSLTYIVFSYCCYIYTYINVIIMLVSCCVYGSVFICTAVKIRTPGSSLWIVYLLVIRREYLLILILIPSSPFPHLLPKQLFFPYVFNLYWWWIAEYFLSYYVYLSIYVHLSMFLCAVWVKLRYI